jgi:hypothetical protein
LKLVSGLICWVLRMTLFRDYVPAPTGEYTSIH